MDSTKERMLFFEKYDGKNFRDDDFSVAEHVNALIADGLAAYGRQTSYTGVATVADFNRSIVEKRHKDVINVTEVLQARRIASMADEIRERGTVKMVLIAGPSSSGKTTFSKRLSVQLMAVGLKPLALSLDDYFVDRDKTPLDENGKYDFESLYAVDLALFNEQLEALISGQEVELPRFDFETGKRVPSGRKLAIDEDTVLVVEGIHALNPLLTERIADECKYRIFCSVLTSVYLDDERFIPSADNRLLRRILRDSQYRGFTASQTIALWTGVQRGEEKWIFPFMKYADVMFDSSFIYELAVMKEKLVPVLAAVDAADEGYAVAQRLSGYLEAFEPVPDKTVPPTSLLREFFGGSSFHY